jgi:hypothetical protein
MMFFDSPSRLSGSSVPCVRVEKICNICGIRGVFAFPEFTPPFQAAIQTARRTKTATKSTKCTKGSTNQITARGSAPPCSPHRRRATRSNLLVPVPTASACASQYLLEPAGGVCRRDGNQKVGRRPPVWGAGRRRLSHVSCISCFSWLSLLLHPLLSSLRGEALMHTIIAGATA